MTIKNKPEITVYAYGFDRLGFLIEDQVINESENISIKFIPFKSSESLDSANGLIIPQGIFERIEYSEHGLGTYADVKVNKTLMLDRDRQITNLLKDGNWICFLVSEIIDDVPDGYQSRPIRDTDLCKILLNKIGVRRHKIGGSPSLSITNEFHSFIRQYGSSRTLFDIPHRVREECSYVAKVGDYCAGFEFDNSLFFLPFHTTQYDRNTAESLTKLVTRSVLDYRQKRIAEIPDWIKSFEFVKEVEYKNKISDLTNQLYDIEQQLHPLISYKLIVNTSGELLKKVIVDILENFFGFKVDSIDERREDAKILDEKDITIVMIEVKGTKTGIKREYINQVDIHRERNGLTKEVPGVLIINNEMDVEGIEERLNTNVPSEQIKHAVIMNVLIVRTIDFLFLMKHLESDPSKKDRILELINSGGGWMKADKDEYEIVRA